MSRTSEYISTTNYSPERSFLGIFESLASWFQNSVVAKNWPIIARYAQSTVLSLLSKISRGQLTVEFEDEKWEFGKPYTLHHVDGPSHQLSAKIKILKDNVWTRLLFHADFGFADAYLLNEIDVDSLNNLFRIFILNRQALNEMDSSLSPLWKACSYFANTRLANRLTRTASNISAHYDLPPEVFRAFLSRDFTYSCAVFDDEAGLETGDFVSRRPIASPEDPDNVEDKHYPDDLERGQLAKLRLVANRAGLLPGCRVLEIGCGWGSFAIMAAQEYGAQVEAITISVEQLHYARERIEKAGLSDSINVHFLDYRELPASFHHAFDAVVSIGVMEHVGAEFMTDWFKVMSWAMKPENSFKVFTMTTVPDTRWKAYSVEVDFVQKYIYPGGQLSSVHTLVNSIQKAGLNVHTIEDIGPHYARTLREWSYRWDNNFDSHIKPAMRKHYPTLKEFDIGIFRRKFKYYFAYSEAGFAMRNLSDHVFTLTREVNLHA